MVESRICGLKFSDGEKSFGLIVFLLFQHHMNTVITIVGKIYSGA